MASPFQGTPNMSLQLDGVGPSGDSGGGAAVTAIQPVMPVEGESPGQFVQEVGGWKGRARPWSGVYHGVASGVEFDCRGLMWGEKGEEGRTLDART